MHDTLRFHAESLYLYPIKACAGLRVARLDFLPNGMVVGDREWVVVDARGEVTWQGTHPRLALVQPILQHDQLVVTAPGEAPLTVPVPGAAAACEIRIWNDTRKQMETHTGFDAGPEAARLLQATTGAPLRLIRLRDVGQSPNAANPVHLVSRLSLDELNQQLAAHGAPPAEAERLRPNIVLDSTNPQALPFLEEQFASLHWGTGEHHNRLNLLGKCVRCVVPDVHPATATVDPATSQAMAALSAQRYPGEPSYFGVYATAERATSLFQGEALEAELQF